MKETLLEFLNQSGTLSYNDIFSQILAATVISLSIYISYWYTHEGTIYSKKFNLSLVVLTILTATVMTVIGNNVALSLGMVGALSIVRFRTAIKDSRDAMYIFWAVVIGICCGVGDYLVATIGSSIVFVVLILFGKVKNENRILVVVSANLSLEKEIEGIIFKSFNGKAIQRVKNTTKDTVEEIFEVTRKEYEKTLLEEESIVKKIYKLGNVNYVNIVTQSDEISG
ncbi:DUF4956 domain-containing protein [Clostridium sp. Sa3CUN1]|uniref:DUF4956 domain-containing protein n=1 Tax=Clostridium gallinarum TaxID=2762246 RepID=A0ABR8Q5P4_9CLOT|nr:DUF4956 domain-containing protein [Clostridium gallinarum]MBD7915732.1 DUF4956 domain-containing protein [Clostridium gallinarum]